MSEYQYYEFRAVDRPLTRQEMGKLRAISTRAQITATSFVNTYEWGDFKGDPDALMEKYFDAFVYVANWGTHRFMLRLPRWALKETELSAYCAGDGASAWETSDFIVLDFLSEDEGGDWEEGEGYMASLIPLRADLTNGDLRCLYLGWLLCARCEELDEEDLEPPVPPGLAKLSAPLQMFAEFLRIEKDLIEVAAEASVALEAAGPSQEELAAWIAAMPEAKKNALLLEAAAGDNPRFRVELLRSFKQDWLASEGHSEQPAPPRRTVSELLSAAKSRATERERREAERQAAEEARLERERAADRAKYLETLAGREKQAWEQVSELIRTTKPKNYDQAVSLLVDLRELAVQRRREGEFNSALERLRALHSSKPSFLRRLEKAVTNDPPRRDE
jgi:predicted  nucleic acid-binding Zn-ribbon protein